MGGLQTGGGSKEGACQCDCHISFEGLPESSEKVLALFGQQLERCGPGQLACPAPPACPAAPKCPAAKPAPPKACPERACEACEACTPCRGLPWWWLVIAAIGAFGSGAAVGPLLARRGRRARAAPWALLDVAEAPGEPAVDRGGGVAPAARQAGFGANAPKLRRQLAVA